MAAAKRLSGLLRDKKGDEAVSFLMTTVMLVLIFATLVSALVYVTQYYNASYICRRAVRGIEIAGEYDEAETEALADRLKSGGLEDIRVMVDAPYISGTKKIQLKDTFDVTLTAKYRINILTLGADPVGVDLPVRVKVTGMSEVYWKS